ncbi:hypothetical protein O181_060972 [Austropuccinia psidii MF-1]|uniref:Uncharacterized protein n=1 Tax=Austropuccinia psidii MF-1 TaxID=1389203 RepID=A0A9Q3EJQ0_9BASI|nr:hypothetical protein [Austropuccinia psidii MF-1]
MEDSRTCTSAQRDIPVSVQELVYGIKAAGVGTFEKYLDRHNELIFSSEEVHEPRNYSGPSGGWTPMSCKGQVQQIKAWFKNQSLLSEDQQKKLAQGKENSPVEAPQASTIKNLPQQGKKRTSNTQRAIRRARKRKRERQIPVEKALHSELQNYKQRKDSHGKFVQYGKKSDGVQKQVGRENEIMLFKEIDLVKLVTHFEMCNKEIMAKFNDLQYIQQTLGREILQLKESQRTIIGLEGVNKDRTLSLTHICERIEYKVTFLNQPEDNSIYFITKQ